MAQFDVHRNTGRQKDAIPYVVVVQSSLFDGYRRRVVVPLVRRRRGQDDSPLSALADSPLNPGFHVEGIDLVLHPLEIVSVSVDQLGKKVTTLANEGDRITAALDELLTRAWS
jgi:toxin CcdB